MNIEQAKQEVIHTIHAYLERDEQGRPLIPVERQRPILLMGPPGIGKTAIMEQVAEECGINLVAYTITHHTRQSAIGLPFIAQRQYDGREYSVTEYTMSEIIASVYDAIESSGIREGIKAFNQSSAKPYELSGSMGHSLFKRGEEISNCLRRADINMYADKRARKRGRK